MRRLMVLGVVVGSLLAGCADGAPRLAGSASSLVSGSDGPDSRASTTAADLVGRYLITALSGFTEVPGSHLALVITADRLVVDGSGCTPMGGPVEVAGGRLEVALDPIEPFGICDIDPAFLEQDDWLFAFLAAGPQLETDGDLVVLTVTGTGVVQMRRVSSEPAAALVTGEWRLVGAVRDGVLTAAPAGVTLRFGVNGRLEIRTACTVLSAGVSVTDTTLTSTGPVGSTKPCDPAFSEAAAVEDLQRVLAAAFTGTAGYVLDGDALTVTGDDGVELTFVHD